MNDEEYAQRIMKIANDERMDGYVKQSQIIALLKKYKGEKK